MDDEAEAKINNITNAVQGLAALLDKDGAICTQWILVAEWMDSEGKLWFSTHAEPNGPVWRVNGMLDHATAVLMSQHLTESDENNEGSSS